nr:uncharacterized protein LOC117279312 [Nicotiana tomentosiformis]
MYVEMPKQNRVKNLFKSIKGSSSLAPEQSSHAQSQVQASSDRVSLRHTQPIVPSSSTNRVSSQNVIPSSSSDGVSSQPTRRRRVTDDSELRDWVVDVADEHQVIKSIRLKVQNVHNLENGLRRLVGALLEKSTDSRTTNTSP